MDDSQQAGKQRVSSENVSDDFVSRSCQKPKVRGRVLVVDDEPFICDFISNMLARAGYEAITSLSGTHAVELFRLALVEGNGFDIALLDLMSCGGMGGEKTVQALHAHDPALVAIALSGYEPAELPSWNVDGHFADFLKKPFLCEALLRKMGDAMAQRKKRTMDAESGQVPFGKGNAGV